MLATDPSVWMNLLKCLLVHSSPTTSSCHVSGDLKPTRTFSRYAHVSSTNIVQAQEPFQTCYSFPLTVWMSWCWMKAWSPTVNQSHEWNASGASQLCPGCLIFKQWCLCSCVELRGCWKTDDPGHWTCCLDIAGGVRWGPWGDKLSPSLVCPDQQELTCFDWCIKVLMRKPSLT